MTREEAARILDPETTVEALAEIEYYNGLSGPKAQLQAVSEACEIAAAALRELPEAVPESRGDIVRSMTDSQLAYWMVYLSVHHGDPGYDLSFIWCDGHGPCMADGNCRDHWSMDCVLRYLACKAPDIEIPQRPNMRIRDHEEYFTKTFSCPSCGKRICSYTFGGERTDNGLQLSEMFAKRVCPSCSQAINWSEQVIANKLEVANETTDD